MKTPRHLRVYIQILARQLGRRWRPSTGVDQNRRLRGVSRVNVCRHRVDLVDKDQRLRGSTGLILTRVDTDKGLRWPSLRRLGLLVDAKFALTGAERLNLVNN